MMELGFKEVKKIEAEPDELVLFYDEKGSEPVFIRKTDLPLAIANHFSGDAIVTDILDRFVCSTYGCFLNRLNPEYDWIRKSLCELQMEGVPDDVQVEFCRGLDTSSED